MDEPIRILHITEMLSAAGIESFIMNMYRNIDRTKVQFDFLVLRNQEEFYDDEIKSLGGHKYYVHSNKSNTLLRVLDESKQIETFLKKHPYNIVHIHYTTPLRAPYLLAAKKAGVPVRIYHSHSAYISGKSKIKYLVYDYMRHVITKWGTHYFACSEAAAEWMFEKKLISNNKVNIIHNGIDTTSFSFNSKKRSYIRNQLGINENFTICNVGRFTSQKNQLFLVKAMPYIIGTCPDARLLLLGDGPLKKRVEAEAKKIGVEKSIIFLGVKNNVSDYLSASDVYVMPSLYEGLPVSGIEAECNGIPCIFSKNITEEVKINDNVKFISLDESLETWAKEILKYRYCKRFDQSNNVRNAGYDITDVANKLEQFYIDEERKIIKK